MEHDTGSGYDPAAPNEPDERTSPQPVESAGAGVSAEGGVSGGGGASDDDAASDEGGVSDEGGGVSAEGGISAEGGRSAEGGDPHEADQIGEAAAERDESREALTSTGEPRVDAVLGRLGELDELPVSEHPGVYERIHEQLVDVLGELHHGPQKS